MRFYTKEQLDYLEEHTPVGRHDPKKEMLRLTDQYRTKLMCHECRRPCGGQYGFTTLMIPNYVWTHLSPAGDDTGQLCICCMASRVYRLRITRIPAFFVDGPFDVVGYRDQWMGDLPKLEEM